MPLFDRIDAPARPPNEKRGNPFGLPLLRFGRHNWTRTNDPHHVKVVL